MQTAIDLGVGADLLAGPAVEYPDQVVLLRLHKIVDEYDTHQRLLVVEW